MDPGLFFVFALFYFLPTAVALLRGIKTPQGPILLNLLLGWTILGWVAALIWAACAPIAAPSVRTPGLQTRRDRGSMYQLGRYVRMIRGR